MTVLVPVLTVFLGAAGPSGESVRTAITTLLPELEVRELPAVPSWYPPGSTLLRFVQFTDVHLNHHSERLLREACRFVNEHVKPAFVAITGDNAGSSTRGAQQRFRDLVTASLKAPCFVVPGDNWPQNFVGVFGSFQWSFDCGGIHVIASGLDVDLQGMGIGHFLPETVAWLTEDITRNAGRPVVYFQHQPIQPPTFLDAHRLDTLFESSPNVLLTMSGHVHVDLESRAGRVVHIVAPALGPSPSHGFKVVEVYADRFVVRTVEHVGGAYRFVKKYQRIDIPAKLRRGLGTEGLEIRTMTKRPARDTSFEPRLAWRQFELGAQLLAFKRRIRRLPESTAPPPAAPKEERKKEGK